MYSPKYVPPELRRTFKTPEGLYRLKSEKRYGQALAGGDRLATRLTLADLKGGKEEGVYIILNVGEAIHICLYNEGANEPVKVNYFRREAWPVCHCFAHADDGADLLVGMSSGEVLLLSLRQQLQSSSYHTVNPLGLYNGSYRPEDDVSCTAVAWADTHNPTQFVATFSDGTLRIFDKGRSISTADVRSVGGVKGVPPGETLDLCCGCIHDAAISPDGTKLAVVSKDGLLRVFDANSRKLLTGFQSYYGGLLCCAWSPDSKYIATGGEDDMVSVFGVDQGCIVAFGEGHNSWISQVAFDPSQDPVANDVGPSSSVDGHEAPPQNSCIYRVGSVAQDTQVALWDIEVDLELEMPATSGRIIDPNLPGSPETLNPVTSPFSANSLMGPFASHRHSHEEPTISENGEECIIAPAMPHREMDIVPPVMIHKLHHEPVTDILFTRNHMFTCDCGGHVRCWFKPSAQEPPPPSDTAQEGEKMQLS